MSKDAVCQINEGESIIRAMIELSRLNPPELWPEPYRQIFAQAVLPACSRLDRHGQRSIGVEHAKGLSLLRHFYFVKRTTLDRIPLWIVRAECKPELNRSAENVRQNLSRRIRIDKMRCMNDEPR